MKKILSMYQVSIKSSFATAAAYRLNFFFNMVLVIVGSLIIPLATLLIYGAGASLKGWTLYEALLFQSVFMLITSICSPLFYNMVWITMRNVREGNYDLLLIKPCSVITLSAAYSFNLEGIGSLIGAVAVFVYAVLNIQKIGFFQWLSFAYFIVCGIIFVFGIVCLMSAITFKWVGNSRIFEMFDSVTTFSRYPLTIYPKWLSLIITSVFPIAILGVYPAYALLGLASPVIYMIIIPCLMFAVLGVLVFKKMVGVYQSAGG